MVCDLAGVDRDVLTTITKTAPDKLRQTSLYSTIAASVHAQGSEVHKCPVYLDSGINESHRVNVRCGGERRERWRGQEGGGLVCSGGGGGGGECGPSSRRGRAGHCLIAWGCKIQQRIT